MPDYEDLVFIESPPEEIQPARAFKSACGMPSDSPIAETQKSAGSIPAESKHLVQSDSPPGASNQSHLGEPSCKVTGEGEHCRPLQNSNVPMARVPAEFLTGLLHSHSCCDMALGRHGSGPPLGPQQHISCNIPLPLRPPEFPSCPPPGLPPPPPPPPIPGPVPLGPFPSEAGPLKPPGIAMGPPNPPIPLPPMNPATSRSGSPVLMEIRRNRAACCDELLPTCYADEIPPSDRIIKIVPFNKRVYATYHHAAPYDFNHYSIVMRIARPYEWYKWPAASHIHQLNTYLALGEPHLTDCIESIISTLSTDDGDSFVPYNQPTPKVWAPAALTAPPDEDMEDCIHGVEDRPCECSDRSSKINDALERTALVYYVVFSTWHIQQGGGRSKLTAPIFKVMRCGSRDAAAAEIFYAAGAHGWSTVFAAVGRQSEIGLFEKGVAKIERVTGLWCLAEMEENDKHADGEPTVKIFY